MKQILILGTGGNCLDILDTINDINRVARTGVYACAGFLDDNKSSWGKSFMGIACLGPLSAAADYPDCRLVNGIGSTANFWRKRGIIATTGLPLDRFETIVHPSASISETATIGRGTVVFQQVTITNHATVGDHVIVLPNSVVSHDVEIGDYACVTGGVCLSGGVQVEQSCYLGSNCTVNNGVRIGEYSLIGMGAVVLHDVSRNSVMVGNPARYLRPVSDKL